MRCTRGVATCREVAGHGLDATRLLCALHRSVGTIDYLAPEMLKGGDVRVLQERTVGRQAGSGRWTGGATGAPEQLRRWRRAPLLPCRLPTASLMSPSPAPAPPAVGACRYDPAKVDTWSMGVLLYLLVAGWYPFEVRRAAVHRGVAGSAAWVVGRGSGQRYWNFCMLDCPDQGSVGPSCVHPRHPPTWCRIRPARTTWPARW